MQRAVCSRQGGSGPPASDFWLLNSDLRLLPLQWRAVKRRLFTILSALSLLLFGGSWRPESL